MSIAATLLALGVGGMVFLRNSSQVDSVAQSLVTNIRMAQNNSIAIKNSCASPNNSKIWGVEINNNDFSVLTLCNGGTYLARSSPDPSSQVSPHKNVTINSGNALYIYFSTPFGNGYVNSSPIQGNNWILSGSNSQDYIPNITPTGGTTIDISSNGYSRTITIASNGDVSEN